MTRKAKTLTFLCDRRDSLLLELVDCEDRYERPKLLRSIVGVLARIETVKRQTECEHRVWGMNNLLRAVYAVR